MASKHSSWKSAWVNGHREKIGTHDTSPLILTAALCETVGAGANRRIRIHAWWNEPDLYAGFDLAHLSAGTEHTTQWFSGNKTDNIRWVDPEGLVATAAKQCGGSTFSRTGRRKASMLREAQFLAEQGYGIATMDYRA